MPVKRKTVYNSTPLSCPPSCILIPQTNVIGLRLDARMDEEGDGEGNVGWTGDGGRGTGGKGGIRIEAALVHPGDGMKKKE